MIVVCKYKKINNIINNRSNSSTGKHGLATRQSSDKVLHIDLFIDGMCNTLSGTRHANRFHTATTPCFPFRPTTMLDDRATCRRAQVFGAFGPTVPGRNRLLQQFHPQREMVHSALDSAVRTGRALVLRYHRLFPGRQLNRYTHQPDRPQFSGDDRGTARRKASLSLPLGSGAIVPARQALAKEAGPFSCLSCNRSTYSSHAMPGHGRQELSCGATAGGGRSVHLGGIYPPSRVRLRAIGRSDCAQPSYYSCGKTNRGAFHPARFKKTMREISPSVLFPHPPVIRFAPQTEVCPCGGRLMVQKTRRKTVLGLAGPYIAHETVAQCPDCRRTFGSEALQRLVPKYCNVGYDLLIFIGLALFRRYRTVQEVRTELVARNVRLSPSEIDYLGRKFITCLAIAHRRATPRIRRAMTMRGGYILHLDATHDGDAPTLMTGMDSLSKIVLANVKVPSEHADHITPFLQGLAADYGTPLACVHDMGTGIGKAVAAVFPGIRDFICHFHFLRDIGKDYLEPAGNQPVFKLAAQARLVTEDPLFRPAVDELRRRCLVFDRLRTAMRIAPAGGGNGLNDEGTSKVMSTIRQGVGKFRWELEEDPDLAADPLSQKMAKQIDKYGDKLFADPIIVDTPNGPVIIYPQRTNNILEQFFRGFRRSYRRKTGNNSMHRALQAMLADTPLIKNLDNPEYMEILLDGKANLEELFAELGSTHLDGPEDLHVNTDRILPGFRDLINLPTLPDHVILACTKSLEMAKSN